MKRTKIICVWGIRIAFTLVLAVVLLGQSGSAQAPGKQAVPEFFGVYLWTDGSLKEIPDVNPEFKKLVDSTDRRATGEKSNVDFFLRLLDICYAVNQKASFVLYHNLAKPEMFSLKRVVPLTDGKQVEIRLGIAPIEGKNFMYRLVPREELTTGVYYFKATGEFGTSGFFSCLAVNTTADQLLDRLKAETTSGIPNPPSTAPQPPAPVAASCADLGSCTRAANAALMSSQFDNATAAWDKILSLGQPLSLVVCRENTFGCEQGTFSLGLKEISFAKRNGQKVLAVPASQVTPVGIDVVSNRSASRAAFRLKVEGKNYNFDFLPLGHTCDIPGRLLKCPEQGVEQQSAVANYVLATLPKLASGALGPSPAPAE